MSFDEIMAKLPKLTPEERQLLRAHLMELEYGDEQSGLAAAIQLAALGGTDPDAVAAPRR